MSQPKAGCPLGRETTPTGDKGDYKRSSHRQKTTSSWALEHFITFIVSLGICIQGRKSRVPDTAISHGAAQSSHQRRRHRWECSCILAPETGPQCNSRRAISCTANVGPAGGPPWLWNPGFEAHGSGTSIPLQVCTGTGPPGCRQVRTALGILSRQ